MTIERNIDSLFAEELDSIASGKQYIMEAEKMLEMEFISSAPLQSRSGRKWGYAAGAVAAMAAAVVAYVLLSPGELTATLRGSERQILTGSWISSANSSGMALDFSDGSEISMAQNTEIRVQDLKTEGAHVALERGNINVSVVHESETLWDFDAGPFKVRVTGTRFSVDWLPEEKVFVLDMAEGSVAVNGPMLEDGKKLAKDDRLQVSLTDRVVEIRKKDRVERIVAKSAAAAETDFSSEYALLENKAAPTEALSDVSDRPSVQMPSRSHRGHRNHSASWLSLARKGRYADAIAEVNQLGVSKVMASGSSRDLMLLGDAARFSNNVNLASDVYKTVRKRFPKTAEAQRAAFTLGRIFLEQKESPKQAAKWFEVCYKDNRQGTMAREAAGRLIEALDRSGDRARAKTAAEEYHKRYPNGPHTKLAEKILSISDD